MADARFSIPLAAEPQSFGITLAGKEYRLTVRWMAASLGDAVSGGSRIEQQADTESVWPTQYQSSAQLWPKEAGWQLDIEAPERAAPIIMGLPLVTGCDLLEPFAYLEFGGELWVDSELPATLDNLGSDVELIFVVRDAA